MADNKTKDDSSYDYESTSPFNAGLLSTNNLIACRLKIQDAAIERNVSAMIVYMNVYYREIMGLVPLKESEVLQVKQHRKKYYDLIQEHDSTCVGPEKTNEGRCRHLDQCYNVLEEYDEILQLIAREHGLLMPKAQDPAASFGRGIR